MAYDPIKITGELYWPCFHKFNEMKPGKHTVDICNLDKENIKKIEAAGLKVRTKEDKPEMGTFLTVTSKYPPKCKIGNKTVEGNDLAQIGNGSKAHVRVTMYDNSFGGPFAGFNAVQVFDLVRYEAGEDDFFDEVEDGDDFFDDPVPDDFED